MGRKAAKSQRRKLAGRHQPPPTVVTQRNPRLIQVHSIPQLARYLLVHLIEPLTIIRKYATPDLVSAPKPYLEEPVRVGQRLTSGGNNISFPVAKDRFRLLKSRDSARGDHRRIEPGLIYRVLDCRS